MKKIILIILLFFAVPTNGLADDSEIGFDLHVASEHFQDKDKGSYNEQNLGLGVTIDQSGDRAWKAGWIINSYERDSFYVERVFQSIYRYDDLRVDLGLGLISGYPDQTSSGIVPLIPIHVTIADANLAPTFTVFPHPDEAVVLFSITYRPH